MSPDIAPVLRIVRSDEAEPVPATEQRINNAHELAKVLQPEPQPEQEEWGGETPGQHEHEATDAGRGFVWLDELASLPFMTEAPEVILPHMALSGRITLLAAEEKSGKSTLIGQAVAALSSGLGFLGGPTLSSRAMWMGLDEPTSDCARRLIDNGAAQSKIAIMEEKLEWNAFYDALDLVKPKLLVIDTLSEWASTEVRDFNSAADWTPVMRRLRDTVARQRNVSIILLHHTRKGSHSYADSRAIGAGVDIILEMHRSSDGDANRRIINYRGRGLGSGSYRVRYSHGQYLLENSAWIR